MRLPVPLVPKLQLGNGIATKVGQPSPVDIIMTSGDACLTFALNQKNEIPLGKKKQGLLVQARSQARAWEREKPNDIAGRVANLKVRPTGNMKT